MLLVMLGAPLLAAITLAALRDYRALAVATGVTVSAYALDAILGSPLSALSLLGPNPLLGVRFYGIGNELEALLSVVIVGGIGAALAGFAPRLSPGRCAAVFLVVGLVFTGIFASGKFGADVGAAIDIPMGVAVAALVVTGGRRRWILLVVLIPLVVVALLALADLLTGANSHFTRSVLDAGGLHSLGDTAQRRLEQTAPQLRPPDPPRRPARHRDLRARRRPAPRHPGELGEGGPGDAGRPDRRRRGHDSGNPCKRFRRPAVGDRRRISAGFPRLGLGRRR